MKHLERQGRKMRKSKKTARPKPKRGTFDCMKNTLEDYVCNYCNFKTSPRMSLHYHIQKSHYGIHKEVCDKKRYICKKCKFTTSSALHWLKHHVTCVERPKKHKCPHCSFKTSRKRFLEKHVIICHSTSENIKWYKCNWCNYETNLKYYLKKHFKTRHGAVYVGCGFGMYQTRKERNIKRHNFNHNVGVVVDGSHGYKVTTKGHVSLKHASQRKFRINIIAVIPKGQKR